MRAKKISHDKPFKFTLRLTSDQYDFINKESQILHISPSHYIRMLIDFKRIERSGVYENK